MGLMNSTWVLDGHDIATAFNLSCFQDIVDLGGQSLKFFTPSTNTDETFMCSCPCVFVEQLPGCTGALAREVLKAFPSSKVTVFDLPHVVEMAQKHFAQDGDNVAFQAGEEHTKCSGHVTSSELGLQR